MNGNHIDMASLHTLPEELVSDICDLRPEVTPSLRLTCRGIKERSSFIFLKCFFRTIPIFAHPASFAVLGEILKNPGFRKAIHHLLISHTSVFHGMNAPHKQLITDGIIRKDLAATLSRLPCCTTLKTSKCPKGIGRAHIRPMDFRSIHNTWYDSQEAGSLLPWQGDAGLDFSSYVMCDMLAAASSSGRFLEKVDLTVLDAFSFEKLEWPALADFLTLSFDQRYCSRSLASLALDISTCVRAKPFRHAYEEREYLPSSELPQLTYRFPALENLRLNAGIDEAQSFFPVWLPQQLRYLGFWQQTTWHSTADTLTKCLQTLPNLEHLELHEVAFDWVEDCAALLRVVAEMSSLREFYLTAMLSDYEAGLARHLLCFQACDGCSSNHVVSTNDVAKDVGLWADVVHGCTCDGNVFEGGTGSEDEDSSAGNTGDRLA